MLINCTNHPSKLWGKAQKKAAEAFGGAVDIPFPQIDPSDSTEELRSLAAEYAEKIEAITRLYNEIGIDRLANEKINFYFEQSQRYLALVSVPEERKTELVNYMNEMLHRQY